MNPDDIYSQVKRLVLELVSVEKPFFNPVRLLAIGCSSSEIAGGVIGHASAYPLGEAVARAALDAASDSGFDCAFQCCEHLNRAVVVERAVAEARDYTVVCAVPQPKAGGSLATAAYSMLRDPVLVETARADAGIDIGQTLIGMHLRFVAVPVRLTDSRVGNAVLTAARTRPRLIGGERAVYAVRDAR